MAICLLYVSTGTANQAASNQCCDTLPGCPRCDPHQDAWKQLPRLTMDDADDASETEANSVENSKTQPRSSNSALSTTNTYRLQMWRRISDAHVISCKRMFPASPVAGFNSASIVPVSTGSISVSTSNPPGIQKIIIFSNKNHLMKYSPQNYWTLRSSHFSSYFLQLSVLTFSASSIFHPRESSTEQSWTFYWGYEARIRPAPGTIGLYEGIGHLTKTSTFQVHPYQFHLHLLKSSTHTEYHATKSRRWSIFLDCAGILRSLTRISAQCLKKKYSI